MNLGSPSQGDYVRVLKVGPYQGMKGVVVVEDSRTVPSMKGLRVCEVVLDDHAGRVAVHVFHLEVVPRAV